LAKTFSVDLQREENCNLKKALRGEYDDSVWQHLAGNVSAPFEAGEHNEIAIKVIDDRGNELMVVKDLKEAK
jgi:adenine-specific DNA-methyltransferase